jgi:hypothetical protein
VGPRAGKDRKYFFYEYPFAFSPLAYKKRTSSVYTPPARSPFWLLKPASEYAHAHLLPWLYEAGLCCYLVIHIGNHYSCFTSICDLFTDSPSYINCVNYGRINFINWPSFLNIPHTKDGLTNNASNSLPRVCNNLYLKIAYCKDTETSATQRILSHCVFVTADGTASLQNLSGNNRVCTLCYNLNPFGVTKKRLKSFMSTIPHPDSKGREDPA